MDSTDDLVRKNMPLVLYVLRRFLLRVGRIRGLDADDLRSAGLVALVKSSRYWQPGRGATFGTYAHRAIWNAMTHEVALHKRHTGYATQLDSDTTDPVDMRTDAADRERINTQAWSLLSVLTPDERFVIEETVMGRTTQRELQRRLGINRATTQKRKKKALAKMRALACAEALL